MKFTIYQESRLGQRQNNEDRTGYSYSRDALLMVVADGMGGHFFGEVAAQIAVQTLSSAFAEQAQPALPDPFLFLQQSMLAAHRAIIGYSMEHHLDDTPRTTCVACLVQDNVAYWAHAGDSRLYLLRNGRVLAQTRDHSRVQALRDQGLISASEMADHPDRNKVYSCLGGPMLPEIDYSRKTPVEANDILVLCTDGVWGVTDNDLLARQLRDGNLMHTVPLLLDGVEQRAGTTADNLSLVAARWEDSYRDAATSAISSISTQTMSFDEITTRCDEFTTGKPGQHDLSEDEIEKAIREIQGAIDKYARR